MRNSHLALTIKFFCFYFLVSLLAACGGGSNNPSTTKPTVTPNQPTLSISDTSIVEGQAGAVQMSFNVSLSANATELVLVEFTTSNGTATAGEDYQVSSGTLEFAAGSNAQIINVTVLSDTDVEGDETIFVTLSSPTGATIASGSATGTINNDDVAIGLDLRPDNQTCVAPERPNINATVAVVDPFPNIVTPVPTKLLLEPVANPRWFVLQKAGQVVSFDPDNATNTQLYIDLTSLHAIRPASEGGLLGMAFHPDYPNTPEIFLSYTVQHSSPSMRSVISRFILDDITSPGAGTVEQIILQVDQDYDNHNGGDIAFGPDGYLYVGFGDGGSANDPNSRSQDTRYLLGAMLRIDVMNTGAGYNIPDDNPFFGNTQCTAGFNANNCPEIYAWGLRNPWRWSFDKQTGELWLADVGQDALEEINLIARGGNYGWRCQEGTQNTLNASDCTNGGLIMPVSEYGRVDGNSITGGQVYRGTAIPELNGRYVFADYESGKLWALVSDGQGGYLNDEIIDTNFGPTSFSADANGELYFTDLPSSSIRKLVPAGPPTPDTIAELLSDTGCTQPGDTSKAYAGLIPYEPNAPFWSDGADKTRFIGLPNNTTITRNEDGSWEFPNGTILVKNFSLNNKLVETRHLMRHPDGEWAGYTYEWNAQQTDATRIRGGKASSVAGQNWIFPSENQCMQCHTSAANFVLGPETAQLNGHITYPTTGRIANQLDTMSHIMMFTNPLPGSALSQPALVAPSDTSASLNDRARAYLHSNCAQCHQPNAPTPSTMDLRATTALADTNACEALPLEGDLNIANARLIAVGDPERSLLVERMTRNDSQRMPPLGSNIIDAGGVTLLTTWIQGLSGCN